MSEQTSGGSTSALIEREEHPDQLSLVNTGLVVPVNPAMAANVEPDGSIGRKA